MAKFIDDKFHYDQEVTLIHRILNNGNRFKSHNH